MGQNASQENCCQVLDQDVIEPTKSANDVAETTLEALNALGNAIWVENIKELYGSFKPIGSGACGSVYSAKDLETGDIIAVKVIDKHMRYAESFFLREILLMRELKHPSMIGYYGAYADARSFYMIIEYCHGGALFNRIVENFSRDTKPFKESIVIDIARQLLLQLEYLHGIGIAHRDIKPENIVFRDTKEESPVVLIDFGLAKRISRKKRYSSMIGTLFYLAPEILEGKPKGPAVIKSDIWSLGVVLYTLCSGRHAFGRKGVENTKQRIQESEPDWDKCMCSELCIDFMKLLLKKNYKERVKASEALQHPWITSRSTAMVQMDVIENLNDWILEDKINETFAGLMKDKNLHGFKSELEGAWTCLDKDSSGDIDMYELEFYLKTLGFSGDKLKQQLGRIMTSLAKDMSGEIDMCDFETAYVSYKIAKDENGLSKAIFHLMDDDGSGELDMGELTMVFGSEVVEEMMSVFDADNSGQIDFEEFSVVLQQFGKNRDNAMDVLFEALENQFQIQEKQGLEMSTKQKGRRDMMRKSLRKMSLRCGPLITMEEEETRVFTMMAADGLHLTCKQVWDFLKHEGFDDKRIENLCDATDLVDEEDLVPIYVFEEMYEDLKMSNEEKAARKIFMALAKERGSECVHKDALIGRLADYGIETRDIKSNEDGMVSLELFVREICARVHRCSLKPAAFLRVSGNL